MVETYEILNQLNACLKGISGEGILEQSARGQIDSAINAVEANNWKFACDRLSLALSQMISRANNLRELLSESQKLLEELGAKHSTENI